MLEIKVTMTIRGHWASNTLENRIVKRNAHQVLRARVREMANLSVEGQKFLLLRH